MMHYEYVYRGVPITIELDQTEDDPADRVNGWSVTVAGRPLVCGIINNSTLLYLGELPEDEAYDGDEGEDEPVSDPGWIYAVDPGVLQANGRRFMVQPISTGRGRAVSLDSRALILIEDPPLEALHPYVDHMLALRELYAKGNVETQVQRIVDAARRQR
jgi:hypothetical protein